MKFNMGKSIGLFFAVVALLRNVTLSAAILTIESNATDNHITDSTTIAAGSFKDGGTSVGAQPDAVRIGSGGTGGVENLVGLFAFALPTLAPGEIFTGASYTFNLSAKDGNVSGFNADVYVLTAPRATPALSAADFYIGPYGNDPTDATGLQDNFLVNATATGTVNSSGAANTAFVNYLNTLYAGNTNPAGGAGQYLFLRINPDSDPSNSGNNRYRIPKQANASTDPFITLTTEAVPEPSAVIALAAGLFFMGTLLRRR